jgi:hypothetical protein
MPMPIAMNIMRQNSVSPSFLQQYRPPVASNNGVSFQFKQFQQLQRRGNMFRSAMISNVIHSKPGCSSCGK